MVISRPEWEAKIEKMKNDGANEGTIYNEIQQRGRDLRPLRVVDGILQLMLAAEKNVLITYDEFSERLRQDSHWERKVLLTYIANICKQIGWPNYTSLVVRDKEKIPGSGFFVWYNLNHTNQIAAHEQEQRAKDLQKECFNAPIPKQLDILLDISKHIDQVH